MPLYSYRCEGEGQHAFDEVHAFGQYPQTATCPECQSPAHRIVRYAPQFNVDRLSEQGYNPGAGAYFHNRSDRREWLRQNNNYEIGPEDSARELKMLKEAREAKADGVRV